MPYYIYRITQTGPVKQFEKLLEFAKFPQASAKAKEIRQQEGVGREVIRIVFGENELEAEIALNTVKPPEPLTGDDW